MSIFDQCIRGAKHITCPGKYDKFYIDAKNNIVYTGEVVYCECKCHKNESRG